MDFLFESDTSGCVLGVYSGDTPEEAAIAFLRDAGAPTGTRLALDIRVLEVFHESALTERCRAFMDVSEGRALAALHPSIMHAIDWDMVARDWAVVLTRWEDVVGDTWYYAGRCYNVRNVGDL